jgi:MFS family permease
MTVRGPLRAAVALRDSGAFSHRNYRLFFAGQGISLVGTWMTSVAQSWLVLQLTGNPFDLGLVAAFQFTPVLLLGLFGGFIADSLPKRQTMYVTQAVAMGVSATLFVLSATGTVQLWHVFALAIVMGIRNSIEMPTRQAFAVEMVGKGDVVNAIALNSSIFNAARIVGPAVGGLTIGALGVPPAFLIDAISFLAVLLGLYLMDETELKPAPRIPRPGSMRELLDGLGEGLGYVRRTPVVLLAIGMIAAVSTFSMNFNVIIPALASDELRVGAEGYGFLMAAAGLGSLVSSLLIVFVGTRPSRMLIGAAVLGAAELAMAGASSYPADLVLMFAGGVGSIAMAATVNTTIQLNVPDALRGRVMSVYTTVFAGSTPLGGLIAGWIAATGGPNAALGVAGVLGLVAAAGGWIWYRRITASPVEAGPPVDPTPAPDLASVITRPAEPAEP